VRRDWPDDIEVGATVELAEVSGSETFVHVRHDDGVSWIVQLEGVHPLSIGDPIRIYVKPRRLFVFDGDNGRLVRAPEIVGRPMAAAE
jgi:glycerol transport system ATP-binding protein